MDSPDLSGLTLGGRYLLVRRIGAGGMGAVYEARESTLGRRIAVKVLHAAATDGETLDRFRREAQVLASLSHVHIVQVSDFQLNLGEPPFLVMEYLEGRSLGDLVRDAPLPPLRVAALAVQVLSALTAAHVAGIIHRDIKPDNIFVVPSPTLGDVVKVLDFGIAKLFGATQEALTREGTLLGTLPYMSPEQAAGEPLDPRTDLYSLAVCMYRACSGALPIDEPSLAGMLRSIISGAIPRLSSRMLVDQIFADIVHRALCRDRDGRFADAAAMASALERYQAHALHGAAAPRDLAGSEDRTAAAPRVDGSQPGAGTWRPPSSAPMAAVALPRALPSPSRSSPSRLPLALGGLGAALGVGVLGWSVFTAAGRARLAPPMVRAVSGATASWTELPPEPSALVSRQPLRGPSPAQSPTASVGPLARACTDASQCAHGATCRDGACECPWRNIVCGGRCVDPAKPEDCGGCGIRCADDEVCGGNGDGSGTGHGYTCQPCSRLADKGARCGAPHECVDLDVDARNCGACGKVCAAGQGCRRGACFARAQLHQACKVSDECVDPRSRCMDGTCKCASPANDCGNVCAMVCPK
jgi:serine/threonine protein kinase